MQALLRHQQFKIKLLQVAVGLLLKNGSLLTLLGRAIGIIYVYASDVGILADFAKCLGISSRDCLSMRQCYQQYWI
jgi:hypothetical protein